MGRNARLKQQRRAARQAQIDESWDYFTREQFLGEIQRLIRDSNLNAHSSVTCTKVIKELANDLGLTIRPLSVEVTVYNPVFADWIIEHGLDPSEEVMAELGEKGGRFVVLGDRTHEVDEEKWNGYLVALMSAKGKAPVVLDLAIDQATRPTDGICIEFPLIFGIPDGFLDGTHVTVGFQPVPEGKICFVYKVIPDDIGYEKTVDWIREYGAKTHDKVDFGDLPVETPPEPPAIMTPPAPRILGPDGNPLLPSGE